MPPRNRPSTRATPPQPATVPDEAPVAPATPARRRYRALQDIEVQLGENRLILRAGRVFASDSIPFDPLTMEPLKGE